MYIATNKSQKMFFISISILGRSGVKSEIAIADRTGHMTRSGNRACFVPMVNSLLLSLFSIQVLNNGMLFPLLLN